LRVIVTRPAAQASEWVIALQAQGIDAVALPLIGIEPAADAAALRAAWGALAGYRLVIFVSPNAAQQFFAQRPAGLAWPAATHAASPGPGTTRALCALGAPAAQIIAPNADAAQFDSESLWHELQRHDWRGADVLLVRGDGGRETLADLLTRHGARITTLAAYRRAAPHLDAAQQALLNTALAEPERHLWFFSSSEAIEHLGGLVAAGTGWERANALATHPRIAATARDLGVARVIEARPALADVIACIQSIRP